MATNEFIGLSASAEIVRLTDRVEQVEKRVKVLEMAISHYALTQPKSTPTRLELAENNLEQCRKANRVQEKEIDRLRMELDVLRKQNLELRDSNQRQDKAICDLLTYKRVVTYDLNLSSPESLLKYVRGLEDEVQRQKEDIDSLEESLSRPRWVTGGA